MNLLADMRPTSLTLRLALWFAASAPLVLLSVTLWVRHAVDRHFAEQDALELHGKVELIGELLARSPALTAAELQHRLDEALVGHHGLQVRVRLAGQTLYRHPSPAHDAGDPLAMLDEPGPMRDWSSGEHLHRGLLAVLPIGPTGQLQAEVAVALDIAHHQTFMRDLDRSLAVAVLLGALILALCGWWAARRGLQPLRTMATVAGGISASRLTTRLDTSDIPAELHELAGSLNAMLDRLQDAFRRLTEFSADIAHELRTPIGNLMMQTQVALSKPRQADDYAEVLHSSLEEYERLARMISDMLLLAKTEHGLLPTQRQALDLAEEVRQLFDFFEALAEDRRITLSLTGTAQIKGDRLMLRRALANLLTNALRYTPPGGTLTVTLTPQADAVTLTVCNPGADIPADVLERLFDRFFCADPARHQRGEGAGLGLAITRAIVEAHGGRIGVRSGGGQTCFTLDLPSGEASRDG